MGKSNVVTADIEQTEQTEQNAKPKQPELTAEQKEQLEILAAADLVLDCFTGKGVAARFPRLAGKILQILIKTEFEENDIKAKEQTPEMIGNTASGTEWDFERVMSYSRSLAGAYRVLAKAKHRGTIKGGGGATTDSLFRDAVTMLYTVPGAAQRSVATSRLLNRTA